MLMIYLPHFNCSRPARIDKSRWLAVYGSLFGVLLFSQSLLWAQPNLSSLGSIQADTSMGLSLAEESLEVLGVKPWKWGGSLGFNPISNDSLLRWEHYGDAHEYMAKRKWSIAQELGTIGRPSGTSIYGFRALDQRHSLEGIPLNNPITGLPELQVIPMYKVSGISEQIGAHLGTEWSIRDYYKLEPISTLNYDESSFNNRNLEFGVGHNLSERTHIELSFWDRRAGEDYPSNEITGTQVFAKGYYHINSRLRFDAWMSQNRFEADESFGYSNPPSAFPFSEFGPSPLRTSVKSDFNRSDWFIRLGGRSDSLSAAHQFIQLGRTKHRFDLPYGTDTVAWDVSSFWLRMNQRFSGQRWAIDLTAHGTMNSNKQDQTIAINRWWNSESKADAQLFLGSSSSLFFGLKGTFSDQQGSGWSSAMGLKHVGDFLNLTIGVGHGEQLPTIQQVFWSNSAFTHGEDLRVVQSKYAWTELMLWKNAFVSFDSWGRLSMESGTPLLSPTGALEYADNHLLWAAGLGLDTQLERWEFALSGNANQRGNGEIQSLQSTSYESDIQLRLRGHAFWKSYVFERAAYTKMGLRFYTAPLNYRSPGFNTGAQWWPIHVTNTIEMPAFTRIDLEISSRVRAMMVFVRWENLSHGLLQPGYFGSYGYPMPGRRLVVSIKATFRN